MIMDESTRPKRELSLTSFEILQDEIQKLRNDCGQMADQLQLHSRAILIVSDKNSDQERRWREMRFLKFWQSRARNIKFRFLQHKGVKKRFDKVEAELDLLKYDTKMSYKISS
jgi:hypothetical protein